MNNKIQNSLAFLYTAFGAMDMATGNTQLSMNDEIKINQALMMFDFELKQSAYSVHGEEYWLLNEFYKTCSDFDRNGLQMKGVFTKYFVYNYSTLHKCFNKLDEIYQKLMKFM